MPAQREELKEVPEEERKSIGGYQMRRLEESYSKVSEGKEDGLLLDKYLRQPQEKRMSSKVSEEEEYRVLQAKFYPEDYSSSDSA